MNVSDREADARQFTDRYEITFPLVNGSSSTVYLEYGVDGVPEAFFIGPDLTARDKFVGELGEQRFRDLRDKLTRGEAVDGATPQATTPRSSDAGVRAAQAQVAPSTRARRVGASSLGRAGSVNRTKARLRWRMPNSLIACTSAPAPEQRVEEGARRPQATC